MTGQGQRTRGAGEHFDELHPVVCLLDVLPEMREAVTEAERPLAQRVLLVPVVTARDQDAVDAIAQIPDAFGFVIVEGIVLRETALGDRAALELLGPGDVLAPPPRSGHPDSRGVSRYLAHGPVRLAALESRFRQAARRWPGLSDALYDRLASQTRRASMQMLMLHLPRTQDRVMALIVDLAGRFGRVAPDGVVIKIRLTHEIIGRLVAGGRPTVTLALRELESAGSLTRLDTGGWILPAGADSDGSDI